MAKHKKSRRNVVQVNPDATINYLSGILTGANNYVSGLLEGATLYNAWVQQEMALEGETIGEYRPDSLRKYLEKFKSEDPSGYARFMADPTAFIKHTEKGKEIMLKIVDETNYGRLYNTDKAMIKAGKAYRDQLPTLLKSKNMDTGLTLLQTYAPNSAKITDKIASIMSSTVQYGG